MSLSALLRGGGDAARAAAAAAPSFNDGQPPSLRHAPSMNDFSLGCAAEHAAADEHAAAAAAMRRADAAATHRLAHVLAHTHLSLRKSSPAFEAAYESLQAANAALDAQAASRGGGAHGAKAAGASRGGGVSMASAALSAATPQPFAPGSCPPLVGVHAWAAQFEERHGARARPSLDVPRRPSVDVPPRRGSASLDEPLRAATPPQSPTPHAPQSPTTSSSDGALSPPASPGRAAAAFAAAPHSSLHMDQSVKEALLCGSSF